MSDIDTHYGGSILAMKGKDCVAIICDNRLGNGPITVSKEFTRIHMINPRLFIGLPVFIPDAQMLLKKIVKHYNLFKLDENREMEPQEFSNMVSYILYSKRLQPYFTSPIVVGLEKDGTPYISGMDCIGCVTEPEDFVTAGTADNNLAGISEALWSRDMNEEKLFVTVSQAFLNAVDRDAFSGWGASCVIIGREHAVERKVYGRCD